MSEREGGPRKQMTSCLGAMKGWYRDRESQENPWEIKDSQTPEDVLVETPCAHLHICSSNRDVGSKQRQISMEVSLEREFGGYTQGTGGIQCG